MEDGSSQLHDSEGPLVSSPIDQHRKSNGYHSKNVSIRERLSHFTWSWFECTMSTGALATLLGQQPFTFHGLEAIGKIFFLLNLVLFVAFCGLIAFRFIMHPSALASSLHHPNESFFFGTFWVSVALILYGVQEYGVPSAGPWLVRALEILFWAYAACALLVVVFQYHVIFDLEQLPVTHAMPAWLLPAYPFLVLGPLAAALEGTQPARASTPILIGGIVFEGLGWSVAFIMYTVYFTRLINSQLPEPSKRPGMFVAVGPAGYTANTFAGLGLKAPHAVPAGFLNNPTSVPTGEVWKMCAVPVAIFIWLLGFWFSSLATVSCIRGYREMHFTLNYWAFIFPNVGLTIGALQIANALDSTAIKAVVSAATVVLVIAWIAVAILNVLAVWRGEVLWPGKDEDMEDLEGHENGNEFHPHYGGTIHRSKGARRREERRKRIKRRGGRRKQF